MPWKKSEPMEQRVEFVLRALRAENFRALCQEYGISTKTGYRWRERFLQRGLGGLAEEYLALYFVSALSHRSKLMEIDFQAIRTEGLKSRIGELRRYL